MRAAITATLTRAAAGPAQDAELLEERLRLLTAVDLPALAAERERAEQGNAEQGNAELGNAEHRRAVPDHERPADAEARADRDADAGPAPRLRLRLRSLLRRRRR